jgi:hypothetical protein
MRYTVTWVPTALDELARIWIAAPDQQAASDAADEIDRRLRRNPERVGVDLGGDRYLEVEPLAVFYSIHPADRLVRVLAVWRLP